MDEHSHARGVELLGRLYGDGYREVLDKLRDVAPDFGRYIVEFVADTVYSRPLDVASRELIAIAALTTLGYALPQLKVHINGALNAGRRG